MREGGKRGRGKERRGRDREKKRKRERERVWKNEGERVSGGDKGE